MRWETRTHWLWSWLIPGRWNLMFFLLGILSLITIRGWGILLGLGLLVISCIGLPGMWRRSRSFSITFLPGQSMLLERHGLLMVAERRINFSLAGSWTFEQTILGRILDYGTLTIGGLGGPYHWENLGQFGTLRRIIESQGAWEPRPRQALQTRLGELMNSMLRGFHRFIVWLRSFGSLRRTDRPIPEYGRFLLFAQEILFSTRPHRRENHARSRDSGAHDFSREEIWLYYRILQIRRVIVADASGRERLHARIQTLNDIRRFIPVAWFRRAAGMIS